MFAAPTSRIESDAVVQCHQVAALDGMMARTDTVFEPAHADRLGFDAGDLVLIVHSGSPDAGAATRANRRGRGR